MAIYRIPFSGAVLVEADSASVAELFASMWTVSVRQLTVGVSPQEIRGVAAADLQVQDGKVENLTVEFPEAKKQLHEEYGEFAIRAGQALTNYFVGEQHWFELYEDKRRKT